MIEFLRTLFQVIFFVASTAIFPAALAWALFGDAAGLAALAATTVFLGIDSLRTDRSLSRYLPHERVLFEGREIDRLQDPSSHLFLTRAPFRAQPRVWITRGAFNLLPHKDLLILESELLRKGRRGSLPSLAWETYLSVWALRLFRWLPADLRPILLGYAGPGRIRLHWARAAFSVPLLGLLLAVGSFYRKRPYAAAAFPGGLRVALKLLENESNHCIPVLPPALAPHALIPPWPRSVVRFGRSCLDS